MAKMTVNGITLAMAVQLDAIKRHGSNLPGPRRLSKRPGGERSPWGGCRRGQEIAEPVSIMSEVKHKFFLPANRALNTVRGLESTITEGEISV